MLPTSPPALERRRTAEIVMFPHCQRWRRSFLWASTWAMTLSCLVWEAEAQDREMKVLGDRERVLGEGFWLYNDLEAGLREARRTGRPLLVTLRCIPCEECVKLDEDLLESDPETRKLLEQFVRVRLVSTNGLDLRLFQFDTDQSFAIFLMDADRTIYGRYGTRSDRTRWEDDVSIEGLAAAMQRALELHEGPSRDRRGLRAKTGLEPDFATPEMIPPLAGRYRPQLAFESGVVRNCIHCHQIGDALRTWHREEGTAFPESLLFPYPHPKTLGMIFDPRTCGTLRDVTAGSEAERAGLQPGDEVLTINEQPILSIADVQWVLHHAESRDRLELVVRRDEAEVDLTLTLDDGWRRRGDLSWRVSSWDYRRIVLGGLKLEEAPLSQRRAAKIDPDAMALFVEHVGEYGEHAVAKQAGFQRGDLIVAYDGRKDLLTETDVFAYGLEQKRPRDEVAISVVREGRELELRILIQR